MSELPKKATIQEFLELVSAAGYTLVRTDQVSQLLAAMARPTELQAMAERSRTALHELAAHAETDEERRAYEARAEQLPLELAAAEAAWRTAKP